MYLHARQFPHLAGMQDSEIRTIARRAMSRHPNLIRIMRFRNLAVLVGMFLAIAIIAGSTGDAFTGDSLVRVGFSLMIVGAVFTLLLLVWNLVWVNTVIFRITREEVERGNS